MDGAVTPVKLPEKIIVHFPGFCGFLLNGRESLQSQSLEQIRPATVQDLWAWSDPQIHAVKQLRGSCGISCDDPKEREHAVRDERTRS